MAEPEDTPVTRPVEGSTVAIEGLLLVHCQVPPVVTVAFCSWILLLSQTEVGPVIGATAGGGLTLTVAVVIFERHPLAKALKVNVADLCKPEVLVKAPVRTLGKVSVGPDVFIPINPD